MAKEYRKVYKDTQTPAFVIRFWDVSKKKLQERGHVTSSNGVSKKWAKHYWEGNISHEQSGDQKLFHSISELLAFIEKHRM